MVAMSGPIIANTYRAAQIWTGAPGVPHDVVNVFHFRTTTATVDDIVNNFRLAFEDQMPTWLSVLNGSQQWTRCDILKLDGSSATQVFTVDPLAGSGSGATIPQGCMVYSHHTSQRGPRGRGRNYIGPVTETAQDNGTGFWDTGNARTEQAAFQSAMADAGITWVVASYVHSDAHDITSFSCSPFMRTQRKRAATG